MWRRKCVERAIYIGSAYNTRLTKIDWPGFGWPGLGKMYKNLDLDSRRA